MTAAEEDAQPVVDPTVYRLRAHAFVNPRVYRLTDDALTWEEEGKPLDGVFYDRIAEVHLAFVPTRWSTNRYRARIVFREGGMAELFNTDYRSFGNMPEQNESYVAFLRELHRRIAKAGGGTVFRKGNSMVAYILNILLTLFIFAMIGLAFVLLATFGLIWIAVVKLTIVLYFVPTLIRYMRRAKPSGYDPLALPDDVLPDAPPPLLAAEGQR